MVMSNFCCYDDFNTNEVFDFVDARIYGVFIAMVKDGRQPTSVDELLAEYNNVFYPNAQLSAGTITHLPEFSCSDFNTNEFFDFVDNRIYGVFIAMVKDGRQPTAVDELLAEYNNVFYPNAQLSAGTITHLPSLQSDDQVITVTGPVPKNCGEPQP